MDMKTFVELALPEARVAMQELSRLKGFNLRSLKGVFSCVKWAVKRAQELGLVNGWKGADKKEFVLELVRQAVPIPFWLRPVVDAVLPRVIDVVAEAMKGKF